MPELKKLESDPYSNINATGDIKQMLKELGTEKAKEIALHGGGGSKAINERAKALEAILSARERIKDDESKNGDKPKQAAYSVVDAASAAVHGRSAAAARSAASDKTAARIAMHMAGERAPVNAKLVSSMLIFISYYWAYEKVSKIILRPLLIGIKGTDVL